MLALVFWLFVPQAPAPSVAPVGSISGDVTLVTRPRRSASRYPGGSQSIHSVQPIPAVVFIEGRVAGAEPMPTAAVMAQKDTAFAPSALVIAVGSSVTFPNEDPFFHNVFSYSSAQRFDLGRYPMDQSKAVTFDEPGIVNVYCEVHEFMRSAIVVVENPFWAIVGEDGSFSIDGVPPGEHTLVLWHADLGSMRTTVRVTDGSVARVSLELGG